jgi:hypothetical protein
MTTILIIIGVAFFLVCAFVGQWEKNFGAASELRKIRKQNERRGL